MRTAEEMVAAAKLAVGPHSVMRREIVMLVEQAQREAVEECAKAVDRHVQRARDAVAECKSWSPAQAEWSRARDLGLDAAEEVRNLLPNKEG